MKRSVEALVMMEMVAAIVAMAIVGLCGVARAEPVQQAAPGAPPVLPVVKLKGIASFPAADASGAPPATFHVTASFSTDTPGAQLFTIQKAVLFLPDRAGTNGRLFKSCGAKQIEQFHGAISRCPKGSLIGSGTVKARALELGITAHGRVNLFNSGHGKNITFNIQTLHPAAIDESIDAPLTPLHGKYREQLTLVVPHSLQEILTGVFVGVQVFDVMIDGTVLVNGVRHGYLGARRCPKQRTLRGVFDFKNWTTGQTATVTSDAKVRCTIG